MSPKRIREEYRTPSSVNTRARRKKQHNNDNNTSNNVHSIINKESKNLRSEKKGNLLISTDMESIQVSHNDTLNETTDNLSSRRMYFNNPSSQLRTPKSVSFTIESPMASQTFEKSSKNNSSQLKSNVSKGHVNASLSIDEVSDCVEDVSESKNKNKRATLNTTKQSLKKSSKSPKIVLKLSKSNSASKKEQLSKLKMLDRNETKISPLNRRKSIINNIIIKNTAGYDTDEVVSTNGNNIKDTLLLKKPVVILQRLPSITPFTSFLSASMEMSVNESHNYNNNTSRKISKSRVRRSNSNAKNNDKRMIRSPHKLQEPVAEPLMSSTPTNCSKLQERSGKDKTIKTSYTPNITFDMNNSETLDSKQQISLSAETEDSEARHKNGTYELVMPKTPNLRRKLREMQNKEIDQINSSKKKTRKGFSQRSSPDMNSTYEFLLRTSPSNKEVTPNPNHTSPTKNVKKNVSKLPLVLGKKSSYRSNKIVSTTASVTPLSKSRSNSKAPNNAKTVSKSSPFVPFIKKPDPKKSATKELPNFAEIHKRMFAKSESVVDAKRRLEERHTALTTLKINDLPGSSTKLKKKPLSHNSNRSPHNRFGFKIRKNDATNCILKKRNFRDKQQQQNRAILQGVRTNRRFELQMKFRNIKP
ncbi:PREDICTED: putative uncharacterized protein DDB_G0285119 [Dufourea novaeangliae]|uniref:Uncharacterized protein n=1 Tax=Dufourea novaeangliae TaxID=178035 RepID=A0A154P347_DUFNO|nr:PREDICTED: putative uncharacterized protein DDB_G0285119 [Dufourea novaeangliae]KZC06359.1 hypothetical protein WN55_10269 [Dufourea novaeangliae]